MDYIDSRAFGLVVWFSLWVREVPIFDSRKAPHWLFLESIYGIHAKILLLIILTYDSIFQRSMSTKRLRHWLSPRFSPPVNYKHHCNILMQALGYKLVKLFVILVKRKSLKIHYQNSSSGSLYFQYYHILKY